MGLYYFAHMLFIYTNTISEIAKTIVFLLRLILYMKLV